MSYDAERVSVVKFLNVLTSVYYSKFQLYKTSSGNWNLHWTFPEVHIRILAGLLSILTKDLCVCVCVCVYFHSPWCMRE